jgi:ribosomal protein S18 acetylase RimI-like enzyme
MQSYRRQGIGRALVKQVIANARLSFARLHVRTDSVMADQFYRSLGFIPCPNLPDATHYLALSQVLSQNVRQPLID